MSEYVTNPLGDGFFIFRARCSYRTRYSDGDRLSGLPERDVRYCNMVEGHQGECDYIANSDPRSYYYKADR